MESLLDELGKLFDNPPYSDKVQVCVWYSNQDEIAFSSIDKDQTIGWLFDRHVFGYDVEEVTYSDKTHGHPLVFVTLTKQWRDRK